MAVVDLLLRFLPRGNDFFRVRYCDIVSTIRYGSVDQDQLERHVQEYQSIPPRSKMGLCLPMSTIAIR